MMASKRKRWEDADGVGPVKLNGPQLVSQQDQSHASAPGSGEDDVDLSLLEALEQEEERAGGGKGGAQAEALDLRGVKRLVLGFERKLRDNLEARMKHMEEPQKFMASEVELDDEVRNLRALAAAPELYGELVRLQAVPSITGLLAHENTDISIDVVTLLHDLTDADALGGGEADEEAATAGITALVDALVEGNALELLVHNLARLDEGVPDEATAVQHTLSILENLVESKPAVAEIVCRRTKLIKWLLARMKVREFEGNKLYSSEILAILLQSSSANQAQVGQFNGVDTLLQAVAMYKARDPRSAEEGELLENLFDALCSTVMAAENKEKFVRAEGVELMIIIMKQRRVAFASAIKALDFALTRCPAACERFVDVLGLKTLFAAFMSKVAIKRKPVVGVETTPQEEIDERVISIIASLFGGLSRGTRRDRLLSKFVEGEFEKIDRLMELYLRYAGQVEAEERRQAEQRHLEGLEMSDEEQYLAKLEAGLFTLQLLALILAHIWAAEHEGMRDRINLQLKQHRLARDDVKGVLQEYLDNIGDLDGAEEREKRRSRIQKLLAQM